MEDVDRLCQECLDAADDESRRAWEEAIKKGAKELARRVDAECLRTILGGKP